MQHVKVRMVCLAKDHTVDALAEDILRRLHMVGVAIDRADIVRDADAKAVEILDARVRQTCQIEIEVVAADCQNASITLA
jgi:hypothetical protein